MSLATSDAVLGDFNDRTVDLNDQKSRLYSSDGNYFIETTGPEGEQADFRIKYTFGYTPLQQYLVEVADGRIQALNIAWDDRDKSEGGQRWFHLREGEAVTSEHPFHWTGHLQNWNSRCADCHSTGVEHNHDPATNRFQTRFSEINVACEACHGPGRAHVTLAQDGRISSENSGFSARPGSPVQWRMTDKATTAVPQGQSDSFELNMCGSCHSLRVPLMQPTEPAAVDYHDANLISLISPPNYHLDGQIREEVFVLGSFLQSKMHQKGVTCRNCHDPHSGRTIVAGNGLCAQCHQSETYDVATHHHHPVNSPGSQCVNCHMPATTYMKVDDRRDHSFPVPRPDLAVKLGVSNSCNNCHETEISASADWAVKALRSWGVSPTDTHWSETARELGRLNPLVLDDLIQHLKDDELTAIRQASLLERAAGLPVQMTAEIWRSPHLKTLTLSYDVQRYGLCQICHHRCAGLCWHPC